MRRLPCKRTSFQIGKSSGKIKTEKQCLSVHSNLKLKYLKIDDTNIQHPGGDVKCSGNYFAALLKRIFCDLFG